ncbi:NAD-P-binding protein [Gloeopeniophorella convolvens]|nr:NAD-P-binding protein [Gloeopeniophorella convolvens]
MPRILITGATGLVGSHVVEQALTAGYDVKLTVRPAKAARLQEAFVSLGDRVQVVPLESLGDNPPGLADAFGGVEALVHVASSLLGTPETLIKTAVEGTLDVLKVALAAGVHKIVVTSSIFSLGSPAQFSDDRVIGADDWSPLTLEDGLRSGADPFTGYAAAKAVAERALWKFVEAHPELDVATIHPSFVYGPAARAEVIDTVAGSTNMIPYELISRPESAMGVVQQMSMPAFCHVSDVGRAHILALKAPRSEKPKRIVICGGYFTWAQAVEHLYNVRPQLRSRLPVVKESEMRVTVYAKFDTSSAAQIIGLTKYIDWKETLENTFDSLLEREAALGKGPGSA